MADPEPFGTTAPFLKIAQAHGVDYTLTLLLADSMQHGRAIDDSYVALFEAVEPPKLQRIIKDVRYVCDFMEDMENGRASP